MLRNVSLCGFRLYFQNETQGLFKAVFKVKFIGYNKEEMLLHCFLSICQYTLLDQYISLELTTLDWFFHIHLFSCSRHFGLCYRRYNNISKLKAWVCAEEGVCSLEEGLCCSDVTLWSVCALCSVQQPCLLLWTLDIIDFSLQWQKEQ